MANENNEDIITSENNDEQVDVDSENESNDTSEDQGTKGEEAKSAKSSETPEAKRARLVRMLSQHDKKYGIKQEEKPKAQPKSGELDYGQKAFLVASGIKGSKETGLVMEIMNHTGKSLDEVLESKYFQAELKELRDAEAVDGAVPKGTKRSGQSASNKVEYWLAKGELPPADQVELRRKVVNAKMKAQETVNPFTKNPVVR